MDDILLQAPTDPKHRGDSITLNRVDNEDNREDFKWAIRKGALCLNKQGKWEYEPLPSNMDTFFIRNCRWDTIQEAIEAFNEARK